MARLDRAFLRKLADWRPGGALVSTLYLDVDGRRHPRRQDYLVRARELSEHLKHGVEGRDRAVRGSVQRDAQRMMTFVEELDRGPTRGLALFSSSASNLWEDIEVPHALRDLSATAEEAYLLPLEAVAETYESFCTVIVDRERARIFLARVGRIEDEVDVYDDVPGRHEQGGWSQARFQRHIDDHVLRHLKHVGEILLTYFKRRGFDHLILAGPEEIVPHFEAGLHDYVRRRVVSRTTLPMTAPATEVAQRSLRVEEEIEAEKERETVRTVLAEAAAGRLAATGLPAVLDALNDVRVGTLVVPFGLSAEGVRCTECGRLGVQGGRCRTCGGPTEPVPDVVESAVAAAFRQSARVETLSYTAVPSLDGEAVGALLRF
jgi:peptide chain release factor subunit 1